MLNIECVIFCLVKLRTFPQTLWLVFLEPTEWSVCSFILLFILLVLLHDIGTPSQQWPWYLSSELVSNQSTSSTCASYVAVVCLELMKLLAVNRMLLLNIYEKFGSGISVPVATESNGKYSTCCTTGSLQQLALPLLFKKHAKLEAPHELHSSVNLPTTRNVFLLMLQPA